MWSLPRPRNPTQATRTVSLGLASATPAATAEPRKYLRSMPDSVAPGTTIWGMVRMLTVFAFALASRAQTFEVASIRPSAPMEMIAQQVRAGKLHLGVSIDQSRADMAFL